MRRLSWCGYSWRVDGDAVAAGRGSGRSSVCAHRGPGCARRRILTVHVSFIQRPVCVCYVGERVLACAKGRLVSTSLPSAWCHVTRDVHT
jgi:hypothetical protein